MQEPADLDVDLHLMCALSEQKWKQHQVDVMNPDQVAVFKVQRHGICENLVGSLVSGESSGVKGDFVELVVEEGPDGRVCEANCQSPSAR